MMNFKKIVAVILSVSISLSAQIAFSQPTSAINMLENLGFNLSLAETQAITRAEFTEAFMTLLQIDLKGSKCEFSDVYESDSYYHSVGAACDLGIIDKGYIFAPKRQIQMNEAIKMMVCALGYRTRAEALGGYPVGYGVLASQLKLYDDVVAADGMLYGESAARLMLNAVNAPVADIVGIGKDGLIKKDVKNGVNLLSLYNGLYYGRGIITANKATSLSEDKGTNSESRIEVDNETFECIYTEAHKMLGKYVEFYYKDNGNDKTIIYATDYRNRNDEIVINARDVDDVSGRTLSYTVDNNTDKIDVIGDIPMIYNGKLRSAYNADTFKFDMGEIRLLDNNGDGEYDVIFVNDYKNYVIHSVDVKNKYVADKYNFYEDLDLSERNGKFVKITDVNGNAKSVADIEVGNVLSALISEDKMVVEAVISKETVKGVVTSYNHDEYMKINVGDIEYETDLTFAEKENVSLNLNGIFHIDAFGRIAGFSSMDAQSEMYCLVKAKVAEKGVDKKIELKIITADRKTEIFETTSSLSIDGKKVQTDVLPSVLSDTPMIIKFSLNKDGKVNSINTEHGEDSGIIVASDYQTLVYHVGYSFSGSHAVVSTAKVFRCPGNAQSDYDYRMGTRSLLGNWSSYTTKAYKANEEDVVPCVFLVTNDVGGTEIRESTHNYLVKNITRSLNEEGDEKYRITLNYMDGETHLFVKDDEIFNKSGVGIGDIIKYSSYEGEINRIALVYDASENAYGLHASDVNDTTFMSQSRVRFGTLFNYDVKNSIIAIPKIGKVFTPMLGYYDLEYFNIVSTKLFVVDMKKDKPQVNVGDFTDIKDYKHYTDYTTAVVYTYEGTIRFVVLYN